MEKQTYRQAVQSVIRAIWTAYDNVGSLRDFASSDEKDSFNKARGGLYDAAIALSKMDDAMGVARAVEKVNGQY